MINKPEQSARQQGGALESASSAQVFFELISRLPVVGGLFRSATKALVGPGKGGGSYSGDPANYVAQFVQVMGMYQQWGSTGQNWAAGQMKSCGEEKGIAEIT